MTLVRAFGKGLSTAARGTTAIDVVDTALSFAVRHEIFTVEEAMDLLHGVQNKVRHAPAAVIAPIATSAEHSYRETPLVDRSRVVDPLLDMRLALSD